MNKPVQTDSIFSCSSGGQASETGPGLQSKPQQGYVFVLKTLREKAVSSLFQMEEASGNLHGWPPHSALVSCGLFSSCL